MIALPGSTALIGWDTSVAWNDDAPVNDPQTTQLGRRYRARDKVRYRTSFIRGAVVMTNPDFS